MSLCVCSKSLSPITPGKSCTSVYGTSEVLPWGTFHSRWVSIPHYQCIAHSPLQSLSLEPLQFYFQKSLMTLGLHPKRAAVL